MDRHQALASYLPESMLITLSPAVSLFDAAENLVGFRDPRVFSYFFHEYVHYLHNISTVSGIGAFINTLELWRVFRETIDDSGIATGSHTLIQARQDHLRTLSEYLIGLRHSERSTGNITHPTGVQITAFVPKTRVNGSQGQLLTSIACDAEVTDGNNTEARTIQFGTLELLEGVAWLLEQRAAQAVDPSVHIEPPPVLPYRLAEAVAKHVAPALSEDGLICCILAALQSTDAPDAFLQVLGIANAALQQQRDPIAALRLSTSDTVKQHQSEIEQWFLALEREFSGNGVFAGTVRFIVKVAQAALNHRIADPFFELTLIAAMKATPDAFRTAIQRIAPCATIQERIGPDDEISRDLLLSFTPPPKPGDVDPEEGLRVLHSVFHYVRYHRSRVGFVDQKNAQRTPCPFYTCCNLKMRQADPNLCKTTPWVSADWAGWNGHNGACWYGTGVRLTRPPKT